MKKKIVIVVDCMGLACCGGCLNWCKEEKKGQNLGTFELNFINFV